MEGQRRRRTKGGRGVCREGDSETASGLLGGSHFLQEGTLHVHFFL